ncbi:MAG TPA: hypothetical protein VH143_32230 [Kofleriaceae bacterium]|nr:hypothetical protein [Kofleriaceae bacterium]
MQRLIQRRRRRIAIVATASNLALLPAGVPGAATLAFSSSGTAIWGFVGWQIIDAVIAVAGLGLLLGSRRIAKHAATILLIVAIALPMIAVAASVFAPYDLIALTVVPIYLAWWLRDAIAFFDATHM